ncbi:MAG: hypothetical protein Q4C74_06575 [Rothia sp. (in: high G+C Gram-positive bacteria)]|nr:hypothetical protein [Rothia sp. (in: high G+C Gram-positive bacteria)]
MRKFRTFSLVLALMLTSQVPASLAETAPVNPSEVSEDFILSHPAEDENLNAFSSQDEAKEYWTPQRMMAALPADLPDSNTTVQLSQEQQDSSQASNQPKTIVEPQSAQQNTNFSTLGRQLATAQTTSFMKVPSATGKVFFSYQGQDFVCSGAAIASQRKNVVSTAAHCLHAGRNGGWHSNLVFVPAYYQGQTPYGVWSGQHSIVDADWYNDEKDEADNGFFRVYPNNEGQQLTSVVGGNGLRINASPAQQQVRVWGWPARLPYNGKVGHFCYSDTQAVLEDPKEMFMGCTLNSGASGGPWILDENEEGQGYVFGVVSRGSYRYGYPMIISTPFDSKVEEMFKLIQ